MADEDGVADALASWDGTEATDIERLRPDAADAAGFEALLRCLRRLADPCEPPIGVGSFSLLYANQHEIVVWYAPVREHQQAGEVSISSRRLAAAWGALCASATLDEVACERFGGGPGRGRWLFAILAQLPGVVLRERVDEPPALLWSPENVAVTEISLNEVPTGVTATPSHQAAKIPQRRARQRRSAGRDE